MKKIILFIWLLGIANVQYGQDCIGDNVTDPCCNQVISTDPYNNHASSNDRAYPYQNPTGFIKNQFDWLPTSFIFNNLGNSYSFNNPFSLPSIDRYKVLNTKPFNGSIQQYLEGHDMHPKNGWELITANFNKDLYPDINAEPAHKISGPIMILYNKYTGLMRYLMSPGIGGSLYDKNIFQVEQKYNFVPGRDKTLNTYVSGMFNAYDMCYALDQYTSVSRIESSGPTAGQDQWTFGDFQTIYDPCVCQYPSNLNFKTYSYNNANVKLEGRGIGVNIPLDGSGNNPLREGESWLNSVNSSQITLNNQKKNWVVKGGIQTIGDAQKLVDAYSSFNDPVFSALMKVFGTGAGIATGGASFLGSKLFDQLNSSNSNDPTIAALANATTKSDVVNGLTSIGDILSGGSKFLSFLTGGSGATPNISFSKFEMQLGGVIEDYSEMTNAPEVDIATPGSLLSNKPNKAWTSYPLYNEALGLFAILNTPKISYDYATIDEEYTYNCGYSKDMDLCNGTFPLVKIKKLDKLVFQFDEPLKYVLNPAAEININKSEIKANVEFFIKVFVKKYSTHLHANMNNTTDLINYSKTLIPYIKSQLPNDFVYLGYDKSTNGDTIYFKIATSGIPIDNVDKLYFSRIGLEIPFGITKYASNGAQGWPYLAGDFSCELGDFKLKVVCDFKHLANKYGKELTSNHVFNYYFNISKIGVFNSTKHVNKEFTNVCGSNYCSYSNAKCTTNYILPNRTNVASISNLNDITITGTQILTQDIYCHNLSFLNANISSLNNQPVRIFYTGSVTDINTVKTPNIIVIPYKSLLTDDILNPIQASILKEHCKDEAKYKAKEPVNKSVKQHFSTKLGNSTSSISLHPNPTSSKTTLTLSGYENTSVSVMIFDLVGREVYTQLEKDITTREHQAVLNTETLQAGTYIVKVFNGTEEKIAKLVILKN